MVSYTALRRVAMGSCRADARAAWRSAGRLGSRVPAEGQHGEGRDEHQERYGSQGVQEATVPAESLQREPEQAADRRDGGHRPQPRPRTTEPRDDRDGEQRHPYEQQVVATRLEPVVAAGGGWTVEVRDDSHHHGDDPGGERQDGEDPAGYGHDPVDGAQPPREQGQQNARREAD